MNIIELAKQAGMEQDGDMWFSNIYKTDMDVHVSHLEAFAKLVAAHERADERGRMCKQCKECLNEKSTSNEANRPAFLGEGRQAN